ncbi:hypothetical protein COCC4DRAFT_38009 [Bipolaris maydis ATCC 48331]|uniref:Uncharacterized protein n=1 Tax=Cochliobolus heterostrophus (strain C4 / ATCC 48331 / race T) TaxID=665024 RepID=N4XSX8_COCH4|nr:uncharacterized protein COCC4DRAFT_38009 [Bipolaris maydis ATCC 48331]KAJ5022383.1 hypothetical protein J3E73DRAFT_374660 [Bipolaris maydis]ENI08267.1 hypothetical protein COCC4DRAFT_38009 [Bipolaris maydis ATCC 48331]KAJ5061082.1 hypothetical protein J3E74DRAFT_405950 [Bipolaris maydis]KAJ6198215.1 hypothetical protein J3E72DRAFT_374227 [Bipolaris maydis]KAJ6210350.1 hypothetical protein PSV09DRAFT_2399109 [Bipolaris maydis]
MKIATLVLLWATSAAAGWECRNEGEKFRSDKAAVTKQHTSETSWTYCPEDAGCCTDGNVWYTCKNTCPGGRNCANGC